MFIPRPLQNSYSLITEDVGASTEEARKLHSERRPVNQLRAILQKFIKPGAMVFGS